MAGAEKSYAEAHDLVKTSPTDKQWKKLCKYLEVGEDWRQELIKIFKAVKFNKVLKKLTGKEKNGETIYPTIDKLFSWTRVTGCEPDDVKVVMIGRDPVPYPNATGIAFTSTKDSKDRIPTIENLLKAAIPGLTFPDPKQKTPEILAKVNPLYEIPFKWSRQGVLMINNVSTIGKGGKRHDGIGWEEFTGELVKFLIERQAKVFIFFGSKAKDRFTELLGENRYDKEGNLKQRVEVKGKLFMRYCHPSWDGHITANGQRTRVGRSWEEEVKDYGNPFERTNGYLGKEDEINWAAGSKGAGEIEWKTPEPKKPLAGRDDADKRYKYTDAYNLVHQRWRDLCEHLNVGKDWENDLIEIFEGVNFEKVLRMLSDREKSGETIIIATESLFSWTRVSGCRPENVKVVIIGLDPVPSINPPGIGSTDDLFPEIRNLLDLVMSEAPRPAMRRPFIWCTQGVLMINNVAAVGTIGHPNRRQGDIDWERFTGEIIRRQINRNDGVAFILFGKEAERVFRALLDVRLVVQPVENPHDQPDVYADHPRPTVFWAYVYPSHENQAQWEKQTAGDDNPFRRANEHLGIIGKLPIEWDAHLTQQDEAAVRPEDDGVEGLTEELAAAGVDD